MRELSRTTFENRRVPADWIEVTQAPSFEMDALCIQDSLAFRFPLPGQGWRSLCIELEVESPGGGSITCSDGSRVLVTDWQHGTHELATYRSVPTLTAKGPGAGANERCRLRFCVRPNEASIHLNDRTLVRGGDPLPGPALGLWSLQFLGDWRLHTLRILGDFPLAAPAFPYPPRNGKAFRFEMAVDFNDDVAYAGCPWTESMLHDLFAEYRRWGVSRCQWIWLGEGEGWRLSHLHRNATGTAANLGRVFPEAVKAAHAHGIEIYGVYKPFEVGEYDRFVLAKGDTASAEQFKIARKPCNSGPAGTEPVTRVDLVKEDDGPAAFSIEDVQVFVSEDNRTYRPVAGPLRGEEIVEDYPVWLHTPSGGRATGERRRARVLRFSGLAIHEPYVVLRVDGRAGSFANTRENLLHVFTGAAEDRCITPGFVEARPQRKWSGTLPPGASGPFPEGIAFNEDPHTPSANFPRHDGMRARHAFDSMQGLIAFARGRDRGLASLSPAFAESRAWWLTPLREMLDAGADGLELRVRHHQTPLSWKEYGFEPPVREAFLERYGVDLWATDDFHAPSWRRLRGEAYTEFYREAKALAQAYGKPLGLHIGPIEQLEPEQGCALEMHLDWRTWIDEGIADSVTLKELWPQTRFYEELLSHTRARGIPVYFSPYANAIWRRGNGLRICEDRIRLAREHGCDGFQFYESAAIVRADEAGRIVMLQPELRDVFQREFVTPG